MIYAKSIRIDSYPSNIAVSADFGENIGHVYTAYTSGDDIPSASYIPTIDDIRESALFEYYGCIYRITRKQAREIKEAIRRNTRFI
jgi:hypothetical protein